MTSASPIEFRPLAAEDLPMLCEWLNRPHLQEWWREGGITTDAVREKYLPRIAGAADAKPFIALLDGRPCGYVQWYDCAAGSSDWWPDEPSKGVVGMDVFLSDGARLGRGLGTAMVTAFAERLFEDPAVTEIRIDPRPENVRAIRCYEKAGFRIVGPVTNPDGPAVMMVRRRS